MNESGEIENKIPVSKEDRENIVNYAKNFGVDIPNELEKAMDVFIKDQNFENYNDWKLELCKWLIESDHETFADALWDHCKEAANDIIFDLQFDKDVRDELKDD